MWRKERWERDVIFTSTFKMFELKISIHSTKCIKLKYVNEVKE